MEKRFEALDSWRGICACMVALFHLSQEFNWSFRGQPLIANSYIFVDFFFVLSGFVISGAYRSRLEKGEGVISFMLRRFGRLYPLHLATLAAIMVLAVTRVLLPLSQFDPRAIFNGATYDFTAIFTNLLLLQGIGAENHYTWNFPSWSISAEFYTYVVFAVLWAVLARRGYLAALVLAVVCPLLLAFFPEKTPAVMTLVRCVFCFAAGSIVQMLFDRFKQSVSFMHRPLIATLLEFAAVGGCIAYMLIGQFSIDALVFSLVVLVFAFEGGLISRLLRTPPMLGLGTLSYSIYMNHIVVLYAATQLALALQRAAGLDLRLQTETGGYLWGTNVVAGNIGIAALFGLVIATSMLTYRFIETPGRQWGARMAKRWNERRFKGLVPVAPKRATQADS